MVCCVAGFCGNDGEAITKQTCEIRATRNIAGCDCAVEIRIGSHRRTALKESILVVEEHRTSRIESCAIGETPVVKESECAITVSSEVVNGSESA